MPRQLEGGCHTHMYCFIFWDFHARLLASKQLALLHLNMTLLLLLLLLLLLWIKLMAFDQFFEF